MKNWKNLIMTAAALAVMSIAPAAPVRSQQTPASSVRSLPSSATPVESRQLAVGGTQKEEDPGPPGRSVAPAIAGGLTRPSVNRDALNTACMAAAVELEKTRKLIEVLDAENDQLNERLETEKRMSSLLAELASTRKAESEALRSAVDAKNETINAKDVVIAAQDKLVAALKTKRPSPWRRLGDILLGAAAIAVFK